MWSGAYDAEWVRRCILHETHRFARTGRLGNLSMAPEPNLVLGHHIIPGPNLILGPHLIRGPTKFLFITTFVKFVWVLLSTL